MPQTCSILRLTVVQRLWVYTHQSLKVTTGCRLSLTMIQLIPSSKRLNVPAPLAMLALLLIGAVDQISDQDLTSSTIFMLLPTGVNHSKSLITPTLPKITTPLRIQASRPEISSGRPARPTWRRQIHLMRTTSWVLFRQIRESLYVLKPVTLLWPCQEGYL